METNPVEQAIAIPKGIDLNINGGIPINLGAKGFLLAGKPFTYQLVNSYEHRLFGRFGHLIDPRHLTASFLNSNLRQLIRLEIEYAQTTGYLIIRSRLAEFCKGSHYDQLRDLWTIHIQTVRAQERVVD